MRRISKQDLCKSPGNFLAFGFGSGLSPIVPGTVGTLAAIPFFLLLNLLDPRIYVALVVIAFIVGIKFCADATESLGTHDHRGIVWDEFVGFWITMCFIPFSWAAVALGFVLFRVFDIVKPFPIGLIDRRIHGGLGIMLDDVVAGIFANLVLRLALIYVPCDGFWQVLC